MARILRTEAGAAAGVGLALFFSLLVTGASASGAAASSALALGAPDGGGEAVGAAEPLADTDSAPVVTFSAFSARPDRTASIRVDMTKTAKVSVEREGTSVRYLIEGAKIRYKNNKNPLRAEHFDSNVLDAKLDATKKGVVLVVRLRKEAETTHRITEHDLGVSLYIDVPAPPVDPAKPSVTGAPS